jgi:pentapeptide MXKDX repeat protein
MKTLLAAVLAAGPVFAPAAFAEDVMKPSMQDSNMAKTHKPAKKADAMSKTPRKMKKADDPMDKKDPMITKDEMTR